MRHRRPSVSRRLGEGLLIGFVYAACGLAGLSLASIGDTVTLVWAPSGIAIAALALRGLGSSWAVFLGACAVNLAVGAAPLEALAIAVGNTTGAVLGALVLTRLGLDAAFARRRDVLALVAAACVSASAAALVGATVVTHTTAGAARSFADVFGVWAAGDLVGIMAVAPALLAWSVPSRATEVRVPYAPLVALVASAIVMMGRRSGHDAWLAVSAVPTACLVWVALRGGSRWTSAACVLLCAITVVGTVLGLGPFVAREPPMSGTILWLFLGASAFMTSMLTALTAEARRAESEREAMALQLAEAQRLESIGQLAGGVAHDFNNVLQAVSASLELLAQPGCTREQQGRVIETAESAVNRASGLVRQLLAFGRRDSGEQRVVELRELVASTVRMLAHVVPSRVRMTTRLDERPCYVRADRSQIDQVVLNLCLNARDAIEGTGNIEVSVMMVPGEPGLVRLEVTDDGSGIPEALRERVFEPFFTTKPPGKGTGLGLSVVYGVVQSHRGRIAIANQATRGTRISVELPAADEPPAIERVRGDMSSAPARQERILLAEDDPHVRAAVRALLEEAGYRVLVANDGQEAVEIFEAAEQLLDGLVLDIVMPRMGGREALARIRSRAPSMPALLCTAYEAHALDGEGARDVVVLRKPCPRDELLASLRHALDVG